MPKQRLTTYDRINNYQEVKSNLPICESYISVLKSLGYDCILDESGQPPNSGLTGGSTDMGEFNMAVLP
jgi:hypothetical protein